MQRQPLKSSAFAARAGAARARGFTYLGVLFLVAFMALALGIAGEVWHTAAAREKEKDLLYAGNQYRRAIERYYVNVMRQYPRTLEDLLQDPRKPNIERYLRKLYFDPITGKSEWGVVKAPDGGVMGVYSMSEDAPIKTSNFPAVNKDFEGAAKYSDWKFVYNPTTAQAPVGQPGQQPGATPGQSQGAGQTGLQPLLQPSMMGQPPK
jgi:type II secretory pathway pseudopilin PulG